MFRERTIYRLIPKGEELVDQRMQAGSDRVVPYGMQPYRARYDHAFLLNRALCLLLCDEIDRLEERINRLEVGVGPVSDVDLCND